MQDKNIIVIVGYMLCGKTSFGKHLAKQLGYDFFDTDTELENKYQISVNSLISKDEKDFRNKESEILNWLLFSKDKAVIATGGGLPCYNNNMQKIKELSYSIYLQADVDLIMARYSFSKRRRFLLEGKTHDELQTYIEESLKQRESYYLLADEIIDAKNIKLSKGKIQ